MSRVVLAEAPVLMCALSRLVRSEGASVSGAAIVPHPSHERQQ
jgi:hypothetical protein